jgi:hypothetical protein
VRESTNYPCLSHVHFNHQMGPIIIIIIIIIFMTFEIVVSCWNGLVASAWTHSLRWIHPHNFSCTWLQIPPRMQCFNFTGKARSQTLIRCAFANDNAIACDLIVLLVILDLFIHLFGFDKVFYVLCAILESTG